MMPCNTKNGTGDPSPTTKTTRFVYRVGAVSRPVFILLHFAFAAPSVEAIRFGLTVGEAFRLPRYLSLSVLALRVCLSPKRASGIARRWEKRKKAHSCVELTNWNLTITRLSNIVSINVVLQYRYMHLWCHSRYHPFFHIHEWKLCFYR